MTTPAWLPGLVTFASCHSDWPTYLETIYGHFKHDFIDTRPQFKALHVQLKRYPIFQDKEFTFWHITTEGEKEDERTPDFRRCERIRWPRPIIENRSDETIRVWPNKRGQDRRWVLWFVPENYVVVLADRGRYMLLWTAYMLTYEHSREKMQKEYDEYLEKTDTVLEGGTDTPSTHGR